MGVAITRLALCCVPLALSIAACGDAPARSGDVRKHQLDAAMSAAPSPDAEPRSDAAVLDAQVVGADASAADASAADASVADASTVDASAADAATSVAYRAVSALRANCRFVGLAPRIAPDLRRALVRCDAQLGMLALDDLSVTPLASLSAEVSDALVTRDHALFVEEGALKSVPVAGGETKQLATDVEQIVAVTPDGARVVFSGWTLGLVIRSIRADQPAIVLASPQSGMTYVAMTSDAAHILYQSSASMPAAATTFSVPSGGGAALSLGVGVLSWDVTRFASLDGATGNVVIAAVDGSSRSEWREDGYTPTAVISFTRDGNGLLLDDANGLRLISLTGGQSTRLANVPPARDSVTTRPRAHIGKAALFRYCKGDCKRESKGFNLVPLNGGPAQSREQETCFVDPKDVAYNYVFIAPDRDNALFPDPLGNIVLADGSTPSLRTIVPNAGYPCETTYGWSPDSSKFYYGVCPFTAPACTLTIANKQGDTLARYATGQAPLFAPNSRHAVVVVDGHLQLIQFGLDQPLFTAKHQQPLSDTTSIWVGHEILLYADMDGIHRVRLVMD